MLNFRPSLTFIQSLDSINHSGLSVVFTTAEHISALLRLVPTVPVMKLIVSFDELPLEASAAFKEWAQAQGVEFMTIAERESSTGDRVLRLALTELS